MTRAVSARRTAFGLLVAGAAAVALSVPSPFAYAQDDTTEPAPATETPTSEAPTPESLSPPPPPADDCNASTLAQTVSEVTASLSEYFAEHSDVNQALIDITRQPSFVAIGQFDAYFNEHPQQADELRAIQAPLLDYKNRCGMQVTPTDALTVLAEV